MRKLLIALASGLIFGFGLIVSAMISPGKVLAFLDVAAPSWDPSLALVLASAVIVSALGFALGRRREAPLFRSEEHTSELQSLMRISYAVFCLKKKINSHQKSISVLLTLIICLV